MTPSEAAVCGMSCMIPMAPELLVHSGEKSDSHFAIALRNLASTPYFEAASLKIASSCEEHDKPEASSLTELLLITEAPEAAVLYVLVSVSELTPAEEPE